MHFFSYTTEDSCGHVPCGYSRHSHPSSLQWYSSSLQRCRVPAVSGWQLLLRLREDARLGHAMRGGDKKRVNLFSPDPSVAPRTPTPSPPTPSSPSVVATKVLIWSKAGQIHDRCYRMRVFYLRRRATVTGRITCAAALCCLLWHNSIMVYRLEGIEGKAMP